MDWSTPCALAEILAPEAPSPSAAAYSCKWMSSWSTISSSMSSGIGFVCSAAWDALPPNGLGFEGFAAAVDSD